MSGTGSTKRKWWQWGKPHAAIATAVAVSLLVPTTGALPAAADDLVFALIEVSKTASPAAPDALIPGEQVTFDIEVSCSSTQTDCISMAVTDAMPAPLTLVSVSPSTRYTVVTTGNSFVATFTTPLDEGGVGLPAGELVTMQVIAAVPLDADASYNGQTVTNTAYVTVDNPESNVQDSADVLLEIPLDLQSTIVKTVTPATVTGFPGTVVNFDVSATNDSNTGVDKLIIQDPAEPATNAFDYLEVTALANVVFPSGANRVQVDWFDGTDWVTGTPAASATLPPDPSLIKGLRLTFSNSGATKIAAGATGSFRIATETTSAVSGIVGDFAGNNLASSQVTLGVDSNTPVLDDADFTIRQASVAPGATKEFDPNVIIGGQPTTVTVGGSNGGDFTLQRMTITEPKPGTTSMVDQGIAFSAWEAGDIEWPHGATLAEVTYLYETTGYGSPETTDVPDTLPDPDPVEGTVLGFIVEFTGTMLPGAYATLPFEASTSTTVASDVTTTNTVTVEVETLTGATATADASDDLTRRSSRVNTTVRKIISPDTIYASPGSTALLTLPAEVAPLPPAVVNSTVGAKTLVVRDDDPLFWAKFNPTAIVATDVPATSTLTVRSWDGSAWSDVPGAIGIVGPDTLSLTLPAGIQGLEFVFTPTDSAGVLPPGFNVQPNIRVVLRATDRFTGDPIIDPAAVDPVDVPNTVVSEVTNPIATPSFATDEAVANITMLPVGGGGGPGVDLIGKAWQLDEVLARSNEQARLGITWGTGGLQYPSVAITDTADDPSALGWDVADTVFEAFDLVRIPAITSGMDSLLQYDAIESVEFYLDGSGWTPAAGNPCAGTACYGTFPGYTLSQTERDNALGVRFIVVENPNRPNPGSGNPSAPAKNSGVASSVFTDRQLDLIFEVRDERRSNGDAVLGLTRETIYNTGNFGEVLNSAWVGLRDESDVVVSEGTASDTILILDRPITVEATKDWSGGPLGIPPVGTDSQYFPMARMTLTARNTSVTRVDELSLAEPTNGTTPFDYVNLADIVSISVPGGATSTSVVISRGAVDTNYSLSDALGLTETELEDVTGIEVIHTGRIDSNAITTVVLDTRLREVVRGTATLVTDGDSPVNNTVAATVRDAGGTDVVPSGEDNVEIDIASDDTTIESWDYGVIATKDILADTAANVGSPAIQYEDSSRTAKITLTGQPTGNVRTTKMVFTDISPSFWNAFNFTNFGPSDAGPVSPAEQVQVDALVGVTYVVGLDNSIATLCNGVADLTDCWQLGTPASTLTLPNLGSSPISDIRGLRFTYTKVDQSNWERPSNPIQTVVFTVERRDTLVEANPSAASSAVPSTLYGSDPAPGETEPGVYSNEVEVTASGGDTSDPTPVWSETDYDDKQLKFQHLPARVEIKKVPFGAQALGVNIPYQIDVINRGGVHEKDLGSLVVTDTFPVDAQGAQLVIPNDPDTGLPYPVATAFTYTLYNASNQVQPAPTVTATMSAATIPSQTITFTLVSPTTLPKGYTLHINATLQLRPQLETGIDVINTATVTADQIFDTCDSYTDVSIQNAQTQFVGTCTSDTRVWALPSTPLTIVKGVRGVEAGPLDANGDPLLDGGGQPFDDLGILKTVPGSIVDCSAPNVTTGGAAEYYRYPCVPITRPGGTEEWVNTFVNGGNIPVVTLAAIDVLPRGNDRGVIVNEARGSKWTPILSNLPTLVGGPVDASLAVYYVAATGVATTRCNATDIQAELGMTGSTSPAVTTPSCLTGGAIDDLPQRNWQLLTQADIDGNPSLLASIVALKFIVTSPTGIVPGQKISIIYQSTTAAAPEIAESATGLDRDSIAYNSIAAAALGNDNGTLTPNRFVIEPRKVGVAMATGGVELAKLLDGLNSGASYIQSNYNISLTCTSVGQSFELRNSNGTLRNPFSITAGSAATLIQGLPLYATCDVSEANYGSVQTITPTTVTAQAAHTTEYLVYDPHPAFDDSRPAIERSTVTNTYDKASLVVGKTIGTNTATNSSGVPITYTNFRFSVTCTFFNGVSTVTVLPTTTFGLNDGQTRTFADLPAGATCAVSETSARGAVSTTHVDTTAAGSSAPISGTSTSIVLTADGPAAAPTNRVQYTNNFGSGSIQLTKAFAGLAADQYGTGSFIVNVSCTANTGGGTVNVWSGTFPVPFSKSTTLVQTISGLAVGAVCVITETGTGGATSVGTVSNVTVANNTTTSRTLTNTFDFASLRLSKNVITDAEDESEAKVILDSPFQISVTCTFNGAPVYALGYSAVTPMEFALSDQAFVDLVQLPAGASCTVTEAAPANAESTSILYTTTSTPPAGTSVAGLTATFTLTRDVSGAPTNTAVVNNSYGDTSFTVTKSLQGGGAAQFGTGPFIVHVYCLAPGDVVAYDGDITLSPSTSMSRTIPNIAKDSVCSVEETNFSSTGADALVYRDGDGTEFDGTGVNVTEDTPAVTIENWYLTGEVEVQKVVSGDAADKFGDGPFEVTLACTRDLPNGDNVAVTIVNPVRPILDGEIETFRNLPRGAECLLTETDTGDATSSLIVRSGSAVTVDAETGWSFTIDEIDATDLSDNQPQDGFEVRNTFDFAELSVTKTVDSAARKQDGGLVSYGPFPVTVECVFDGEPVYATDYDGVEMQRPLDDTEVWLLQGLPEGAECTVTETDSKGAVSPSIVTISGSGDPETTPGTTAVVDLSALPATNSAEITNPYEIGGLQLSKALAGAGADDWATAPFTIRVDCTLTDDSGTQGVWLEDYVFQIVEGAVSPASVSIDTLPAGALCDISEVWTGGANSTEISIDSVVTGGTTASATIAAGLDSDVVVTNTFELSEIDVTKVITGLGAELYGEGPFRVSLTCTREVNGETVAVEIPGGATRDLRSDTLPLAYFAEYTGLPLGAQCDLTETLTGGADWSTVAPGSFVLEAVPTAVTVTNEFGDPSVFVRKNLAGDGVPLYGAGPFEVTLECTREVNGETVPVLIPGEFPGDPTPETRELNSVNGYQNQFDFLPSFANCELTETSSGGATEIEITNPVFQLGEGNSVHELDLENTFELAELTLTKQVVGTAAGDNAAKVFTVELACVLDVDGVKTDIEIPGDAERSIRAGEEVVYEDLPANAECTLTETDNGGANGLVMVYNGLPVIGSMITLTPGDSTLALSNVFMLALTGFDALSLILYGLVLLFGGVALIAYGALRRRRV